MMKKYLYRGQLSISFSNKKFTFNPTTNKNQIAIKYDIPEDDDFQLSLKIVSNDTDVNSITIHLEKSRNKISKENLLDIYVETTFFSGDFIRNEVKPFDKKIQVLGSYTLTCYNGVTEIIFNDENKSEYCVAVNPRMTLHSIYLWLCAILKQIKRSSDLFLFVNDNLIENLQVIETITSNGQIIVSIEKKCYASPITEDATKSLLQWSNNGSVLKCRLAAILKIDIAKVILLDGNKEIIDENSQLDIKKFRNEDMDYSANIFYYLIGMTIRCTSIYDETVMEIMVKSNEICVSKIKKRLEFKLKINKRRIFICRNRLILSNDEVISLDDQLQYCCGLSYDDIESKTLIGEGGFGDVYKCSDELALKEFKVPTTEKMKYNIIREIMFILKVEPHRNIVRFFDIYIDGDKVGVSMEYMKEGSLWDYIDKNGPLPETDIRRFSLDIVHGLIHLHGKSTFHRDIKAANVLLNDDRVAKLCDFGLSKISMMDTITSLYKDRTQTTECGSGRWMAPEVIRGLKYGFKADIWSIGATLVEMITGQYPYHGCDELHAIYKIGDTSKIEYTSPEGMSTELQEFVDACLRPTSEDRPQAHELLLLPFCCQLTQI